MKVKLIKIGRKKVTKTIDVPTLDHVLAEVDKYLVSREVQMVRDTKDKNKYHVIVGMGHNAGEVKVLDWATKYKIK